MLKINKLPKYIGKIIMKVNANLTAWEKGMDERSKKYYGPRVFEIWCCVKDHFYDYEGVNLLGSVQAYCFKDACDIFFEGNCLYKSKELTYKNCKLYDNQRDAIYKI